MQSVHEVLTGIGDTSELFALREMLRPMLPPQSSKMAVLDDEAGHRALQKEWSGKLGWRPLSATETKILFHSGIPYKRFIPFSRGALFLFFRFSPAPKENSRSSS